MMRKQQILSIIAVVTMVLIEGCSSVPLSSMWRMSKLDPLSMNPHEISVAVITHKSVTLGKDSVQLRMNFQTDSGSSTFDETFRITVSNDLLSLNSDQQKVLLANQSADEAIHLFSVSEPVATAIKTLQQKVRVLKRNKVPGKGSMSLGVHDFCVEDNALKTVKLDLLAKFSQKENFIVLSKDLDILEQLKLSKLNNTEMSKNMKCAAEAGR